MAHSLGADLVGVAQAGSFVKAPKGYHPEDLLKGARNVIVITMHLLDASFESACNPVLQAELLNRAETELNVIVGLCIGHDILFTKTSKAPVTTLIVKDSLLGHNPVVGLYSDYHKHIISDQKRI